MGTLAKAKRGQAAVEAALVILPLLALLCATIDFAMALFIRNSLLLAVREGARYAITGQVGAGGATCQDASIKAIVQQNAMGVLAGASGLQKINVSYYNPNTLQDVSGLPNANASGNVVRVTVSGVPWLWMMSGLWRNVSAIKQGASAAPVGLTMSAASSDLIEPSVLNTPPCR